MLIDFFILDENIFIEYNGGQHYHPVKFYNCSNEQAEKNYEIQKERDVFLRSYCVDNNIILIEIDGRKYTGQKLKKYIEEITLKYNIITKAAL